MERCGCHDFHNILFLLLDRHESNMDFFLLLAHIIPSDPSPPFHTTSFQLCQLLLPTCTKITIIYIYTHLSRINLTPPTRRQESTCHPHRLSFMGTITHMYNNPPIILLIIIHRQVVGYANVNAASNILLLLARKRKKREYYIYIYLFVEYKTQTLQRNGARS